MGLRGSLRLVPVLAVMAGLVAAFLIAPAGKGLANPGEVDRARELCGDVRSTVCGEVCFYSNCVECNRVEATVKCNECVEYNESYDCGYYTTKDCNCVRSCHTEIPCGASDGDDCVPRCTHYRTTCDQCEEWVDRTCYRWVERCRIDHTVFRDWHNAYPDDLPSTPTPWDSSANPCSRLPQAVFGATKRKVGDGLGPLHTRLRYWRDGETCIEWTWHVRGNSEAFQGRFIPVNRGSVSNIEPALVLGSGQLPQYHCRPDTGRVLETEVYSTVEYPTVVALTGGVFGTPPAALSYTPEPQFRGIDFGNLPGDPGGPRISGLDADDPSGPIDVNFRIGNYPSGSALYLRSWIYTGLVPPEAEVPFAPFSYSASAPERRMAADTLGVYSFQAAYKNEDGNFVKSNVLTAAVGFDGERASPNPTPTGAPPAPPVGDLVALPTPTRLPTLTPAGGGRAAVRPSAPGVRRITEYGGDNGDVQVVLRDGFTGKLEYRFWNYVGIRPKEEDVGWREAAVPAGGKFVVRGLPAPAYFVFEFRAVDGNGVYGDPSPYFYTWVGAPSEPLPTVDWVSGPSDVTPPPPVRATPPLDPDPVVVTPTPAPDGS